LDNKEQVLELMTLISQIDNQKKEDLLTIVKFLNLCESFEDNQKDNSYKIIAKKYYAPLVSYLNQCHFKIELNIPNPWDMNKFFSNITSAGTQIDLLQYFIRLTSYERKNLLNIVKFVYDYQENKVHEKPLRSIAHKYWSNYIDLTERPKSLPINQNIEEYLA